MSDEGLNYLPSKDVRKRLKAIEDLTKKFDDFVEQYEKDLSEIRRMILELQENAKRAKEDKTKRTANALKELRSE